MPAHATACVGGLELEDRALANADVRVPWHSRDACPVTVEQTAVAMEAREARHWTRGLHTSYACDSGRGYIPCMLLGVYDAAVFAGHEAAEL